jgi:hypothetical protein
MNQSASIGLISAGYNIRFSEYHDKREGLSWCYGTVWNEYGKCKILLKEM